jgi:hypothetical protein
MPQRITKWCDTWKHPIVWTTPTLIPQMQATILTGAGWIDIEFNASGTNETEDYWDLIYTLWIDGARVPEANGGAIKLAGIKYAYLAGTLRASLRLGAGAHTIEIRGQSTYTTTTMVEYQGFLTITELGF